MTLFLIAIAIIVFIAAIAAVVLRGSVGLLSKRLDEDPELAAQVSDDDTDSTPGNIKY